jgi:hypothetical protein
MSPSQESDLPKSGKYLYAIAALGKDRTYEVTGVDGSAVYSISKSGVAAVVSDCARSKIRPERANLAVHKEVLKRRMLSLNQQAFVEQLERVAGKVEMGLRVAWDVPNIFEYFIDIHPELRAARDRLLGNQRDPHQEDKIELGQLFDRLLNEDREAHYEKLEEVLAPCCAEIKRSPPRNINEAVNLNCLVERSGQKQMEDAVFKAAGLFDNNYAFDLNGPWAPHNFVEMDLKLNGQR